MPKNIISDRYKGLPEMTIGKFLKLAEESKDIISLGPGEPDFDSPNHIIKAAKKSLDDRYTHYSPPGGRSIFKEAIIKKLKKENKISAKPENILSTTGSTEGILLSLMCTIDPGEAVLLPDPGFLSYTPTVKLLSAKPLSVPLLEEDGFQINIEKMERVLEPKKTRALILNTPSNPTGTVLNKKVLEEIADFVIKHDLIVLSDEAYEKFIYDDAKHISFGSLNGMDDYTLTLHSFSKTYAMPGFRIGYTVGPENIITAMNKLHIFTTLCSPTTSQITAVEALNGDQKCVEKMRREYDRRRKMITRRVNEIPGFSCLNPKGAFYAFVNIKSFGMKSIEFSEWMLKNAKVAMIPGTEFGRYGEGYIRLSYATSYEMIEKAMDRVEKAVRKLKK